MNKMREAVYPMYANREQVLSVREAFDRALKLFPNNVGCKYLKDNSIISSTYNEIYSEIQKIGSYIYEHCGYAKDKVAFISNTNYPWYISYLSSLYYGCIVVPLDQLLSAEDLAKQIEFADVTTLFFNYHNKDKIINIKKILHKDINYICLDSKTDFSYSYIEIMEKQKVILVPEVINGDDLAEIVFTSGTTGTSKGVMISHYNIASNLMFCTNVVNFSEEDVVISFLPNNHLFFLSIGLITTIYFGNSICLNQSVLNLVRDMRIYKPSIVVMVPAILHLLKREILLKIKKDELLCSQNKCMLDTMTKKIIREALGGNIKTIISGGAFLDKETIDFYKLIEVEVLNGYGISECSPLVSCSIQGRSDSGKVGTVGLIGTCCEAKIVDNEILISGPNVMLGYYKNHKLTSEAIVDGWLKTGDLGYIDEDGYLYITGRKKNLIILDNGENVCPEELEDMIYSIDGVNSVLVYEENKLITAEVFLDQKMIESKGLNEPNEFIQEEIFKLNHKLPVYKHIKKVKVREDQFEMTTTLKIKRL